MQVGYEKLELIAPLIDFSWSKAISSTSIDAWSLLDALQWFFCIWINLCTNVLVILTMNSISHHEWTQTIEAPNKVGYATCIYHSFTHFISKLPWIHRRRHVRFYFSWSYLSCFSDISYAYHTCEKLSEDQRVLETYELLRFVRSASARFSGFADPNSCSNTEMNRLHAF